MIDSPPPDPPRIELRVRPRNGDKRVALITQGLRDRSAAAASTVGPRIDTETSAFLALPRGGPGLGQDGR